MADYSQGKIYKIVGEDGSTYYGSTVQTLRRRMNRHRCDKKTSAYQTIISKMDYEMILIENYPCQSREELERREGWYIRENPCVNRCIPGRTHREYYEHNREEILENRKVYYQDNLVEIREKSKVKYDHNRVHNAKYAIRRYWWLRTFGDPRYTNCVQRCDYTLFQ